MRGVNVERLGRLARTLRVRQRLTQVELSARAGVSRRAVSMLERGHGRRLSIGTVEVMLTLLGARLDIRMWWNGPELDRLLDAAHASVGASVKRRLERWGWRVRVEVSYNRFGERGRIDLLAFQPATRTLLVIEIKTDLVDVQALLGSLDVKSRLAAGVARDLGWSVRSAVRAIVFIEDDAIRRRIRQLDTLFDRDPLRGRAATGWLRRPSEPPTGLLWFTAGVASKRAIAVGQRVYTSRTSV